MDESSAPDDAGASREIDARRARLAVSRIRRRRRWSRSCCSRAVSPAAPQTAAPQTGRVLLLHSFGQNFSPWNRISARFREELVKQSPRPIDLYEVSLQNVRVDQTADQQTFLDYLRALYAERDPDLVVAMGAPAARFFEQHRAQIFPSTPLLIAGADVRTYRASAFNANDTAVAVSFDLPALIDNILQVLPDTTNIAVVIGDSPLERFWVEELRRDFARFGNRVHFDYLNKLSFDEIVQRVASLPPHSAIFYGSVRVDAHGVPQEEDRVFVAAARGLEVTHLRLRGPHGRPWRRRRPACSSSRSSAGGSRQSRSGC